MFERINASINSNGCRVKYVTVRVKVNANNGGGWGIADIQLQEGTVATEYTEHVAEMERVRESEV